MGKRRAAKTAGRLTLNAAGAAAGGAIGALIPGPEGAAIGGAITSVVGDLVNRMLSEREKSRLTVVLQTAATMIGEQEGPPTHGLDELEPMFEGTLLAARDAYEEKKLPVLARLFATAPFTGTPVVNMLGTLQLVQSLSYRQLCIIAVIPPYTSWPGPDLTQQTIGELLTDNFAEAERSLLHDLIDLYERGLVVAAHGANITFQPYPDVVIAHMMLNYPATLVYNGARLSATIPAEDLEPILKVLGA